MTLLPKLDSPVYTCILPSSGYEITFRPFTVKEEKILLIAKEGGPNDVLKAVAQILKNCVQDKIDIENLPIFDIEYLFLQLRSRSVSNLAEIKFKDPDDEQFYDVEVDLNDLVVNKPENNSTITLDSKRNIGIVLRYPTLKVAATMTAKNDDDAYSVLKYCIESVFQGDKIISFDDVPEQEKDEWVDSLNATQIALIQTFFEKAPEITLDFVYVDKSGNSKKGQLKGLQDFF